MLCRTPPSPPSSPAPLHAPSPPAALLVPPDAAPLCHQPRRTLPDLAIPDQTPAAPIHDDAPPAKHPKRPVSEPDPEPESESESEPESESLPDPKDMSAPVPPPPPPPPPHPHAQPPKSPVHKRRRVAGQSASAESAAARLRDAVRAAVNEAVSPKSRQNSVNAVYASFRQRAMESRQHTHAQSCGRARSAAAQPRASCSRGSGSCCPPSRDTSTAPCCGGHSASSSPAERQPQPSQQSQQQPPQQQATASRSTPPAPRPPPSKQQEQNQPPSPEEIAPGVFPGKGASAGCEHYERKCWIKAACCDRYYPCRRCHDEAETHEIDRHATELVACVECGDSDQPVAKQCRSCGVQFARYFCKICKFYENRAGKNAYHCEGCGICRVGKGIGIDNFHCDKCGNCVPLESKDDHPCTERSHDSNCPICTEHLGSSVEQVVFMRCGHSIHVDCLNRHAQTSFKCPICQKCLTDMSDWYRQLDERLARDVMPPEYARRRSQIYCHDCEVESTAMFHFVYHRCGSCGGYNTRVLHQFDQPGSPESGGEGARDMVTAARRAALRDSAAGEATT